MKRFITTTTAWASLMLALVPWVANAQTNQAPEVSLTVTPQTATYGDPVSLEATATDADGTVSKVEFFVNGTLVGEDDAAPFETTVTALPAGLSTYTAKATDDVGAVTESSPVVLTVTDPNSVTMDFEEYSTDTTLPSAAYSHGSGMSLTYKLADGTLSSTAPWIKVPNGNVDWYQSSVIVSDDSQARGVIENGGQLFNLITLDVAGHPWTPETMSVTVTGYWPDGSSDSQTFPIEAADFRLNRILFLGWQDIVSAQVDFSFKGAIDNITVIPGGSQAASNLPPEVTLEATSSQLMLGESLNLTATVEDLDDEVTGVEFFSGEDSLGSAASLPYELAWSPSAAGEFALTAHAADARGAIGISPTLNVTVVDPMTVDTDGDGLPDWWETTHGLNAYVAEFDVSLDADGDGLSLLQEALLGTDPTLADSDSDGINDGVGVGGFWSNEVFDRTEVTSYFINDMLKMSRYPGNPDESHVINSDVLAMPEELGVDKQKGNRVRAYLTPEVSGEYTFWVRGSREVHLYLSPDDKSSNKELVASAMGNIKEFDDEASQQSQPVTLQAGQRYYLEVLQNSSRSYQRYYEVAWTPPGVAREIIPSTYLSRFVEDDDADDDGLPDVWEVANFGSVETGGANADPDGDLVINLWEVGLGTDPNVADSDANGTSDLAEMGNGLTLGVWYEEPGAVINDFVLRADYPDAPERWEALPGLTGIAKYGVDQVYVVKGYFVAPQNGDYQFTSNPKSSNFRLYLSTDEDPANKVLMAEKRNKWTTTLTLQSGQRYYLEGAYVNSEPGIKWRVDGGAEQELAAADVELYPAAQVAEPTLPEGWSRADVFADHGRPHRAGFSKYDAAGDAFHLQSAGDGIGNFGDDFHFVYREQPANGRVYVRLADFYSKDKKQHAGLMLRASLSPNSPHVMVKMSEQEDGVLFVYRENDLSKTEELNLNENAAPVWLRLDQNGNAITGYTSQNGATWNTVGTVNLDLGATPLVGMGVTNYISPSNELALAAAVFDNFHQIPDSDGDGVPDDVEAQLGTDIYNADSDGDGYSDFEEINLYFSDPLMPDLGVAQTVASVLGNTGSVLLGEWEADEDALLAKSVKGRLSYTVNVPADGVYRVQVEAEAGLNNAGNDVFPIRIFVDGNLIDYVNLYLPEGQVGMAHVATPWLTAGNHTVEIAYDNTMSARYLKFNAVRLQSLGEDTDNNGVEDWVETRLASMNSLDPITVSYTSPVCVEGETRYLPLATVNDGTNAYQPLPIPGAGWYANVPLAAGASTAITATFESGGIQDSVSVSWALFNVLEPPAAEDPGLAYNDLGTIRLREDDELLLAAELTGVSTGSTTLTITHTPVAGGTALTPAPIVLGATDTAVFAFAEPGTYTLAASHDDGAGGITNVSTEVEVLRGTFNGNPIQSGLGVYRDWSNPELSPELMLEFDETLAVTVADVPASGGMDLRVRADSLADSIIAARLDEDGPVTGHAVVETVTLASNEQTSVDIIATARDGSQLLGTPIILNKVTPDIRVEVKIFVAGVTFDDGSILKVLTAEDFDEFGRAYVKFIRPSDQVTSHCHQIFVYDGDVLLGKF